MKTKHFLFSIWMLFVLNCCNADDSNIVVCPSDSSMVLTYMIDYTTNEFLGGYVLTLPCYIDSLQPVCKYNPPGDFGDVAWYDKNTDTKLFAGTIIWMGKGQRTFPEKTNSPDSFVKAGILNKIPSFISLYHDKYDEMIKPEVDYSSVWKAIKDLQNTSWVFDGTPAYIYLYRPSVGVGDPKDWYWIVFLKY